MNSGVLDRKVQLTVTDKMQLVSQRFQFRDNWTPIIAPLCGLIKERVHHNLNKHQLLNGQK